MSSPKKRPPPIGIPPPAPNASQNAFAQLEERHRMNSNAFYAQAKGSANLNPNTTNLLVSPVVTEQREVRFLNPTVHASQGSDVNRNTTISQYVDYGKDKTPTNLTGQTTLHSQDGTSNRSRHSQKSGQIVASSVGEDAERTSRGKIEARREEALFKLMGVVPSEPYVSTSDEEMTKIKISTMDLTRACAAERNQKKQESKSPRKKLFGMSIPSFRSTPANTKIEGPRPPMPSKAAKVLGSSPTRKYNGPPRSLKGQRSDTSKSLPVQLYDPNNLINNPGQVSLEKQTPHKMDKRTLPQQDPSQSTHLPSSQHNQFRIRKEMHNLAVEQARQAASRESFLPPPVPKNTPPDGGPARTESLRNNSKLGSSGSVDSRHAQFVGTTFPVNVAPDYEEAIPKEGGRSPSKHIAYNAEEYTALVGPFPVIDGPTVVEGATLVEGENVKSVRAVIEDPIPSEHNGMTKKEKVEVTDEPIPFGNRSAPPDGGSFEKFDCQPGPGGRWSEGQVENSTRQTGTVHDVLLPRFYHPSDQRYMPNRPGWRPSHNSDQQIYFLAASSKFDASLPPRHLSQASKESVTFVFHGDASELDPAPAIPDLVREQKVTLFDLAPSLSRPKIEPTMTPSEYSRMRASRESSPTRSNDDAPSITGGYYACLLTPLHKGQLSPPKTDRSVDFFPRHPSAVPSPLYGRPGPQINPPLDSSGLSSGPNNSTMLSDGSDIVTHFGSTNNHMDYIGYKLQQSIEEVKREVSESINKKHDEAVGVLDESVGDIISRLNKVERTVDRLSADTSTVNSKLDQLLDFIKDEVVGPLNRSMKKTLDMEKDMRTMQKTMVDLKKKLDARSSITDSGNSPSEVISSQTSMAAPSLPQHRSQPSLDRYYGTPRHEAMHNVPMQSIPSGQGMQNDGRFRQYYTGLGQTWYSANINREQQAKYMRAAYPPPFQFPQDVQGHHGGGYLGGYQGQQLHPSDHQNFGSDMTK